MGWNQRLKVTVTTLRNVHSDTNLCTRITISACFDQLSTIIKLVLQLHWSKKVLAREEKCLFLMYFWTLNSNIFPEFLYLPHLPFQAKGLESSAPGH